MKFLGDVRKCHLQNEGARKDLEVPSVVDGVNKYREDRDLCCGKCGRTKMI